MDIEDVPKLSRKHREAVLKADCLGCYFCFEICTPNEITEWADKGQTAFCPHCDTDALLPNIADQAFLAAACERWFCDIGAE